MIWWVLPVCAVLLSIERIAYFLIWHYPDSFQTRCRHPALAVFGEPVAVLQKLFYLFKVLQLAVFFSWCLVFTEGSLPLPGANPQLLVLGGILISIGMLLNFSVFYSLGRIGVFYGNKLGYEIPWVAGFPFSLCPHPQYVGTVLSIWGFFLLMRFPHPDWILLPLIETLFYALGAYYERDRPLVLVRAAFTTVVLFAVPVANRVREYVLQLWARLRPDRRARRVTHTAAICDKAEDRAADR
jgi:methylene-fatty-acyl-phospholipid synthase